jgi:hypothetical protein
LNFFLFLLAIAPPSQEQKSAPERERGERSLVFHPAGLAKGKKKKKRRKKRHNSTHTRIYGVSGGWEKEPDQTEPKVKINSTFIFSLFYFLFFTFTFTSYFLFYFFSGGYTLLLFANWGKTTKTFSCGWWVCFFFSILLTSCGESIKSSQPTLV